ncbi:hypothetical protein C2U70_00665 [Bradyrhizobium guangdongense]|uniref:hypothetical protein n=1 Tax=Bradyrhizobium guangdongense TaxID=1325090 RepID=UPI00112770B3|nr:hypothetical protein [Bradyrhizobium guangdongense]TPQ42806.1 hypothetical protein C2U70_00665 [Bradyrhizobium guangdongense]
MKVCLIASILVVALVSAPALVLAAPPTVTPSPGYDRRLQESRSATTSSPAPVNPPTTVRKSKKKPAS